MMTLMVGEKISSSTEVIENLNGIPITIQFSMGFVDGFTGE